MRCWGEGEGIRARGEKRLGRILWRAVAGKQHVTWKAHCTADDEGTSAGLLGQDNTSGPPIYLSTGLH